MRKVNLTEKDLTRLVNKVLEEQRSDRYMFFSNLQQIRRQMDIMLEMDPAMIEDVLENGHDWAQDHIATAKESIDQVFDFFMNKEKEEDVVIPDKDMMEGKNLKMKTPIATLGSIDMKEGETTEGKKNVATNQKLWKQSLSWAKTKYDVCPSAYCNGAAVKRYNSKGGKWKKE